MSDVVPDERFPRNGLLPAVLAAIGEGRAVNAGEALTLALTGETLLVVLDAGTGGVRATRTTEGEVVLPAFSDVDAVRAWTTSGSAPGTEPPRVAALRAEDLVELALEQRVGGVLLDPGGPYPLTVHREGLVVLRDGGRFDGDHDNRAHRLPAGTTVSVRPLTAPPPAPITADLAGVVGRHRDRVRGAPLRGALRGGRLAPHGRR